GFLNVPKIKGTHTAMKSGMLAAEALAEALAGGRPAEPTGYEQKLRASWVWEELVAVRNVRPSFAKLGMWGGLLYAGIDTYLLRGKAPWTLHNSHPDNATLLDAEAAPRITYPKPDGVLTFDRLSSVFISNTNHEENQPPHLTLRDAAVPIAQGQVGRLVFLVVGVADEHRGQPVEGQHAVRLRIGDARCGLGVEQGGVVGVGVVQRP